MTEKANAWVERAESLIESFPTHENALNYFRILILFNWANYRYEAVLNAAGGAQDYLLKHSDFSSQARIAEFALHKLSACLALKDFKLGTPIAKECIALFKEGSVNWLISQEYHFQLGMQTGNYHEARAIYDEVIQTHAFSQIDALRQERWLIFGAFLHYTGAGSANGKDKFNLYKFINAVPNYSHDKQGFNVSILVLQVLFLAEQGKFKELMDRTEALRIYSSRYLKGSASLRSKIFIKMLQLLEKKEFNPQQVRKSGIKYLEQLNAIPLKHVGQSEMEIIPPEQLWEMMLQKLERTRAAL